MTDAEQDKAALDFVVEAGPRAFTPMVPASVRLEIARSSQLGFYREALKTLAQNEVALIHAEIRAIGQENRRTERKAVNGIGVPYARFPLRLIEHFKMMYGDDCWPNEEFMEDCLKHHPELRIKVTRGTRGQEYAGRGR